MQQLFNIIHTQGFHYFIRYTIYLGVILLGRRWLRALLRRRIVVLLRRSVRLGLLLWSRWREPYQIQVVRHEVVAPFDVTIAFVADLHLGVYKDEHYLLQVVQRLNALDDIDIVLVGGDWTLRPSLHNLDNLLLPLAALNKPVYAVLGNHDEQHPGPDVKLALIQTLERYGVRYLENDIIKIDRWYLVGLGDLDAGRDQVQILDTCPHRSYMVVLTHHPDTTRKYKRDKPLLTLAGHTHCGQIRIPRLYRYLIPTTGSIDEKYDCGWYDLSGQAKLFITSGLGETLLPLRLFNKPTIDVLKLGRG